MAKVKYDELQQDIRFKMNVTREDPFRCFMLGFMSGGEASTKRIQDYVDAGGNLKSSGVPIEAIDKAIEAAAGVIECNNRYPLTDSDTPRALSARLIEAVYQAGVVIDMLSAAQKPSTGAQQK